MAEPEGAERPLSNAELLILAMSQLEVALARVEALHRASLGIAVALAKRFALSPEEIAAGDALITRTDAPPPPAAEDQHQHRRAVDCPDCGVTAADLKRMEEDA